MSKQSNMPTKNPTQKKKNRQKKKTEKKDMVAVSVPAAKSIVVHNSSPKIKQTDRKSTRITHREFVAAVTSPATAGLFFNLSYPVNPGMSAVFPWLSGVARNWEKYKFFNLKFLYVPRCSSTTPGSVMMALDYDAADAAPISEQVIMSYDSCKDAPPWQQMSMSCPKEKLSEGSSKRYIRHAVLASNLDIKTYDVGTLQVACADCTASTNLGKVFVEYDVELSIPQVPPEGPEFVAGVNSLSGGSLSAAMPLGTAATTVANSIATVGNNGVNNVIAGLSSGTYNLTMGVSGTGLGNLNPPSILGGQGTVALMNASTTNAAATTSLAQWVIQNVGLNSVVQLPSLSAATSVTTANLRMNKVLSDIVFP